MEVTFVTTNRHKFEEAQGILHEYPIDLEHLDMEYAENHDDNMQGIVTDAATHLVNNLKKPVIIEDTGLYFDAYVNFPGALPKFVFQSLGYKGILKLLDGEPREAHFVTVVGYCEPGAVPELFEGTMKGTISEKVYDQVRDVMPYDRIFVPEGYKKTISKMSMEEKNTFSQRAKAFHAFGQWVRDEKLGNDSSHNNSPDIAKS